MCGRQAHQIGVNQQDELGSRLGKAPRQGRRFAAILRQGDQPRFGKTAHHIRRAIFGAVIHHQHVVDQRMIQHCRQHSPDAGLFVIGGDHTGQGHGRLLCQSTSKTTTNPTTNPSETRQIHVSIAV